MDGSPHIMMQSALRRHDSLFGEEEVSICGVGAPAHASWSGGSISYVGGFIHSRCGSAVTHSGSHRYHTSSLRDYEYRVSREEIVTAAFIVQDGWYGGQYSYSYAFQCGDFRPEIIEGTLAEIQRYSDEYVRTECPNLNDQEAFYRMREILEQAVEYGVADD